MFYDKEKYESLISSSPLFSLDKDSEYTAFKRESYKMVEYLYCYLLAENQDVYEQYGCEITEVSRRCINNYESSKGIFLHYFKAAWKKEFSHITGDELIEKQFRGVKISDEDKRYIRKFIALSEKKGINKTIEELYKVLAESMGITIEKIKYIASARDITVTDDNVTDASGEIHSLWDIMSDHTFVEDDIEAKEGINEILSAIDVVFSSLQKRQKSIISDLITAKLCAILSEDNKKHAFISDEILIGYEQTGIIPTQRELAFKYCRDEASLSRSYKEFIKKLKGELNDGIK